jgi:hypothetical protein
LLFNLIFCLRKKYNSIIDSIKELGPLVLTEYKFASGVADQVVKKSEHDALNRELRAISLQIDCATQIVDTFEEELRIKTRWQRDNAQYVKMLEYIDNRTFVHIVEELHGLVVSRLMELDKINLAGSGT